MIVFLQNDTPLSCGGRTNGESQYGATIGNPRIPHRMEVLEENQRWAKHQRLCHPRTGACGLRAIVGYEGRSALSACIIGRCGP